VAGPFATVLLLATVIVPDLFIRPSSLRLLPFNFWWHSGGCARHDPRRERDVRLGSANEGDLSIHPNLPDECREYLLSKTVHTQFGGLFVMKAVTFATELSGVLLKPFILWFSLPPCVPAIVDFSREFSVHVDGLGHVCGFAEFDFQRHGNIKVRHTLSSFPFANSHLYMYMNSLARQRRRLTHGLCPTTERWKRRSYRSR